MMARCWMAEGFSKPGKGKRERGPGKAQGRNTHEHNTTTLEEALVSLLSPRDQRRDGAAQRITAFLSALGSGRKDCWW